MRESTKKKLIRLLVMPLLLSMLLLSLPAGVTAEDRATSYDKTFGYTGSVQQYTVPASGYYKLEVWGASGGHTIWNGIKGTGGNGGYSVGYVYLTSGQTLQICVGGMGTDRVMGDGVFHEPGGYNGGGDSGTEGSTASGAGGGATHIALGSNRGELKNYTDNRSEVLIVAGGGGGGCRIRVENVHDGSDHTNAAGGAGGGLSGGDGTIVYNDVGDAQGYGNGLGGTQTGADGRTFGEGGASPQNHGGGGGGGWYGGSGGQGCPGGGGSGYIGGVLSSLTYKGTVYTSSTSTSSHTGNGSAAVTYLGAIPHHQIVQVRYENADGTFTGYSNVIDQDYDEESTVTWSRAADSTYKAASVSYTVTADHTEQVTVYRQIYHKKVLIRYENADGTFTGYETASEQDYRSGSSITWSRNEDSTYQKANVNQTADSAGDVQITVYRRKYLVTLDKGTGIDSVSGAGEYRAGQTVTLNAVAAKGYQFDGWSGSGTFADAGSTFVMPTNNTSYTASAVPVEYDITYHFNGGDDNGVNPREYTVESEEIELMPPSRTGYDFAGWSCQDGDDLQDSITLPRGSTGDREYTAHWEARTDIPYTVNQYLQDIEGESYSLDDSTDYIGTADAVISLVDYIREYEGFSYLPQISDGENPEEGDSEKDEDEAFTDDGSIDADADVDADGNKGTEGNTGVDGNEGTDEDADAGGGAEDGKEDGAAAETAVIAPDGSLEIDLYYDRDRYHVALGGTENTGILSVSGNDIYRYGQTVNISAEIKEGYEFSGWTGDISVDEVLYSFGMPARDIAAAANAKPIEYSIRYDLDGGHDSGKNFLTYTIESEDITLVPPVRDGYLFMGWSGSNGEIYQKQVLIPSGSIGNREYTAHWNRDGSLIPVIPGEIEPGDDLTDDSSGAEDDSDNESGELDGDADNDRQLAFVPKKTPAAVAWPFPAADTDGEESDGGEEPDISEQVQQVPTRVPALVPEVPEVVEFSQEAIGSSGHHWDYAIGKIAATAGAGGAGGGMIFLVFFWFFRKCKIYDAQNDKLIGKALIHNYKKGAFRVKISDAVCERAGTKIYLVFGKNFVRSKKDKPVKIVARRKEFYRGIERKIDLKI